MEDIYQHSYIAEFESRPKAAIRCLSWMALEGAFAYAASKTGSTSEAVVFGATAVLTTPLVLLDGATAILPSHR